MGRMTRKRVMDLREVVPDVLPGPQGAGGTSIIPSPGPAPISPPMTDPVVHTGPYTVDAGTTLYATGLAWLFESGSSDYFGPLVNNGVIWSSVVNDDAAAFTYMSIGRYNNLRQVTNNGVIVLESAANLIGRTIAFANADLVNTGSIYVLGHGSNTAALLEFGGGVFDNAGLIAVRSDGGFAYGFDMYNGGLATNREGGSLLVEGQSAIAIFFGDGTQGSGDPSRIVNGGLIEARSLGQSASIGIVASHIYGQLDFVNSGTLRADYAYVSTFNTTMPFAFVDNILNEAGGRIEGHMLLDRGDDVVVNHGVIAGHVLMEEGADVFDNRDGVLDGVADMGWGDDWFRGGDSDERVAGGDGDDLLEGADGQDLLMGGWGDDTLIGGAGADGLFGEYGDDRIVTQGQDYASGGAGDDRIEAGDFAFETLDGGDGFDTVVFNGGARALDLAALLAQGALAEIEALVLTGGQSLCVRSADITGLTGGETALRVTLSATDRLDLVGSWVAGADQLLDGVTWRAFSLDGRTILVAGGGAVALDAAPSGTALDDLVDPLAPLPGQTSGLGFTSGEVYLTNYGLTADTTVAAEQSWFSGDGEAVVLTQDGFTFTNNGLVSSYRDAFSDAHTVAFAIGSAGSAGGPVVNNGTIELDNQSSDVGGGTTFGVSGGTFSSMTNNGTITVYGAGGRVSALSVGNVYNHGTISAVSGAGPVITVDLQWYDFQNYGDITAHCGGSSFFFGDNWQGRPLSVAVVAYRGDHANYGTITATSAIAGGAVGIWFEVSGGSTETFHNSGTITADVAIHVRSESDGRIDLTNTHVLNGRVELAGGDDHVVNTGTINGLIQLGGGDDTFDGRGGSQGVIFAGNGNDTVWGGDGNDVVIGGGGNDTINGGNGYDIAGYSGVRRAYTASATSVSGNGEGVDTLTGIEDLAFTDGRLTFARDSQAAQVMRLYDAAFNRGPDQSGFEALLDTLENGALTLSQLSTEFINSVEFQSQYAGLTNQQFVEQLYQFCLNRAGDSGGVATWTAALDGGMSRAEVLLAFSESSEHKDILQSQLDQGLWVADELTLQIARLYDATYDRLPDQGGLATWRNALGGGMALIDIAQAFATAPEFQARYGSLSNQAFVELMYQLCLDRDGDPEGIQTWVDALNGGMSRGEVLFNFSESSEHVALTRDDYLGGVQCVDVGGSSAPLTVPPADDGGKVADHDGGPLVLPGLDPDDGSTGVAAKGEDVTAPQVLPTADTDAGLTVRPMDGLTARGHEAVELSADPDAFIGDDAPTAPAPEVSPLEPVAKVADADVGPLVLPGLADDDFLLSKADLQTLHETGPQVLPAEEIDAGLSLDAVADALQIDGHMALLAPAADPHLLGPDPDQPFKHDGEHHHWG